MVVVLCLVLLLVDRANGCAPIPRLRKRLARSGIDEERTTFGEHTSARTVALRPSLVPLLRWAPIPPLDLVHEVFWARIAVRVGNFAAGGLA